MKIIQNIKTPTGNIYIGECSNHGLTEFLSLGDYGKEKNIKADFMGLEREVNGVPNGEVMPLSEKWVITISTQHGCSMGCKFCDVPKVGRGVNIPVGDLIEQVMATVQEHPEVKSCKRLNIHYARMGEPTFNKDVIWAAMATSALLRQSRKFETIHPVVSTMLPKNNNDLSRFLQSWCKVKNEEFEGEAGLQFSINTTSQSARDDMFGDSLSLEEISDLARMLPVPRGRKYTLNFALSDAEIDAEKLRGWFNPEHWLCKITPMHETKSAVDNNFITTDGYTSFYPYKDVEARLKEAGFDVIVFIPSKEEDESRITCGNAILADKREKCNGRRGSK